tara:strand:+ start:285 stop:551 length:267 start_codon:yes stop_codon:yes gene_type:complete
MKILDILKIIKEAHLESVMYSRNNQVEQLGLCTISKLKLKKYDSLYFKMYLEHHENKRLTDYMWSIDYDNTERLEWLNKHIELNSKEA